MKNFVFIAIACVLAALAVSCATPQKGPGISTQKDITYDIRDVNWDFSGMTRIYFYTETVNSPDEKEAIAELMGLLSSRGIECILDTGESITYDGPSLQIKAHRKLMSVLTSIYLMKPGVKGNEEVIAVISADSPVKAAGETLKYIDGYRPL